MDGAFVKRWLTSCARKDCILNYLGRLYSEVISRVVYTKKSVFGAVASGVSKIWGPYC